MGVKIGVRHNNHYILDAAAVALLVREYGYGVTEVAKYLGRDQANISTMLSRLSARQTERS